MASRHVARIILAIVLAGSVSTLVSALQEDPLEILKEADRLAWLRNWSKAEPLFARAEQQFLARSDQRNALYARVGRLRGELPRLSIQQTSNELAELLENPIVQNDPQLRLRVLIVKGDTDMDLDIDLAQRDWSEALMVAKKLGDVVWESRAMGELGLIEFMQGNTAGAMVKVAGTISAAQQRGDVSSQVRFMTLSASAMTESGNATIGLRMLDGALAAAGRNPDLGTPVMTYTAKAKALAALNRTAEANQFLEDALQQAKAVGSLGYQAVLLAEMGAIANKAGNAPLAIAKLKEAMDQAERADGHGQVAEISSELAKIYSVAGDLDSAEKVAQVGLDAGRRAGDKFHLPSYLTELANVKVSRGAYTEAASLYEEAIDVINAQLIHSSSPANKASRIATTDSVFLGYFRLAATKLHDVKRAFSVVEQARGRSVADLIATREEGPPQVLAQLNDVEKRISALQVQLMKPQSRDQRQKVLDELLVTELRDLAPVVAETNRPWVEAQLKPALIEDLQKKLRPDELLLEYVLDDPSSFCIVISRDRARLQQLGSGADVAQQSDALLAAIHNRMPFENAAKQLYTSLLAPIEESRTKPSLIVVPDGALHRIPLEVVIDSTGKKLLDTHVVTYVPSGSVLALLKRPRKPANNSMPLLAVSASPGTTEQASNLGRIQRGVFDLEDLRLPPLPAANDEVKSVAQTFGNRSVVLVGQQASEASIKAQPLGRFRILHFALHGLLSTTYPERSALILQTDAASGEDGLLQAREISQLRLNADLVTLSACDTGNGKIKGQDGVSALIRPFLVAGAQSVVANLWQADDEFTLTLMREFYRRLAGGTNIGTAMTDAKRQVIKTFGTEAPPALWAGFVVVGDGGNSVTGTGGARP